MSFTQERFLLGSVEVQKNLLGGGGGTDDRKKNTCWGRTDEKLSTIKTFQDPLLVSLKI